MKNTGQTAEDNMDSGVLSSPLSFLRSGDLVWNSAGSSNRNASGHFWLPRSDNTSGSNYLRFRNTDLGPQNSSYHGYGFAVCCVANPSPLSLILAIL